MRIDARRIGRVAEWHILNLVEHPDDLLLSDLEHPRFVACFHLGQFLVGQGKRRAGKQAKGNRKAHPILRGLLWFNYPPRSALV